MSSERVLVGQIVKAAGGYYDVLTPEGMLIRCKPRGVLRIAAQKTVPLVGDRVTVKLVKEDAELNEGVIESLLPRQNQLIRPSIANVDQVVVVASFKEPDFHNKLVDKIAVHAEHKRLGVVICLTKLDLLPADKIRSVDEITQLYTAAGYPVVAVSVKLSWGLERLKPLLKDRSSVLAGQSGVGKTSLLSQLLPDRTFKIGSIGSKGRGRHTTSHVELLRLPFGGQLADTPGFSRLSFEGFAVHELAECFPEFRLYKRRCRFRGCLHEQEPGCAVLQAVNTGRLAAARFHSYLQFLKQLKSKD